MSGVVAVERVDPMDELLIGFVTVFPKIAFGDTLAFLGLADAVRSAHLFRVHLMLQTFDPNVAGLEEREKGGRDTWLQKEKTPDANILFRDFFSEFQSLGYGKKNSSLYKNCLNNEFLTLYSPLRAK